MKKTLALTAFLVITMISAVAGAEDIWVHSHGEHDYYVRTETFKWNHSGGGKNSWSVKIIRLDRNHKNYAPFFSTYTFFEDADMHFFRIYHDTSRREGPTLRVVNYKRATRPEEHIAWQTKGHMNIRYGAT